ncbi:hypothetical protein WG66_014562 [Moniliophthora roreri]|nr:hypothetical protein WG66_014562 [Moniliophthora roreri]
MLTYCVVVGGKIILGSFRDPAVCRNIQAVSYAAPAATTAVATFLIGIKAWEYLRISRAYGVNGARLSTRSRVEGVIVLLLESGLAYFLFFLVQAILTIPAVKDAINRHPGSQLAVTVFLYQTSSIVGMYPTIVICLVHTKRSTMDTLYRSDHVQGVASISLNSFRTERPGWDTSGEDIESEPERVGSHVFKAGSSSSRLA